MGVRESLEEGRERDASPAGGAYEAVHPDAAVPAALEGRHGFAPREAGQLAESERPDRGSAPAGDRQPERRRLEIRNPAVVEDEELLVRDDLSGDAGEVGVAGPGTGRKGLEVAPGEDAALTTARLEGTATAEAASAASARRRFTVEGPPAAAGPRRDRQPAFSAADFAQKWTRIAKRAMRGER